jgi:nitrate/nitrite transporter NarK
VVHVLLLGHLRRLRRPGLVLTIYFNTQYGLDPKMAGFFTAACVFAGSLVRPIGGNVADRIGGIKSLTAMYVLAAIFLAIVSFGLPEAWQALAVFVCAMLSWAWATARCSSWCPSASARRSA